jgi:hypothetical protein
MNIANNTNSPSPLPTTSISHQPDEIMIEIFKYCEFKDLNKMSLVNKHWKNLTEDDSIWHYLCIKDFQLHGKIKSSVELGLTLPYADTWKYSYLLKKMGYCYDTRSEGLFKNGLLWKAKKTFPSGTIVEGEFENGTLKKGKITFPAEMMIDEGEFENSILKNGKRTFFDGVIIEGEFKNNRLLKEKEKSPLLTDRYTK